MKNVIPELETLIPPTRVNELENIYRYFDLNDANRIKKIEKITKHDVKAVEYFITEKFREFELNEVVPYIHIFLTSEDVTNSAYALMIKYILEVLISDLDDLLITIEEYGLEWKLISMLAHTHGQPAFPTTMGKEFINYAYRLRKAINDLKNLPIEVKWNGATGNYNAHYAAYPSNKWPKLSRAFIKDWLGFEPLMYTAQTNNYYYLADILHKLKDISSILIDFNRDMWLYISMDYLKQRAKEGEIGSSTMPHKINPINFENAEGNFELAEINFGFLASKLQKSRLQRDLSDSTTLRNLGTFFGWFLIGINSTIKGLDKIEINKEKIKADLNNNPAVISEAIQSVLRRNGIPNAYEELKKITRGQVATLNNLRTFIKEIKNKINLEEYDWLHGLLPEDYTGCASGLINLYFQETRKKKNK